MRVLVIEDDADAAEYLAKGLRESGHGAEVAADGRGGLLRAASEPFDVLIVDRMLPGVDGLSLVQHLRATGHTMPVLFLSALGEVDDRVKGLRAGGDDYLVKPYAFSELLARIENLGRRQSAKAVATSLRVADLELDLSTRKVTRAGQVIDLQPREFQLLETLMRHPGQVDDPDHAAGEGLELPFRPADQRHRRPHQPPAPEDRSRFPRCLDPHRARRRILPA